MSGDETDVIEVVDGDEERIDVSNSKETEEDGNNDDDLEANEAKTGEVQENKNDDAEEDDELIVPVTFDWSIYVDATLAGLAVLVPLPFVDNLLERFFRRRMIGAIATRRKIDLPPDRIKLVNNRLTFFRFVAACFYCPFFVVLEIVISFFKLLVYCCTIKKATDALNYYWQRAFLMDYILQRGYLTSKDTEEAERAIANMERLLDDVAASPLNQLASKIVYGPCRIMCSLLRYVFRTGRKDSSIDQTEATMSESWQGFSVYFQSLAKRYEEQLEESQRPRSMKCCCSP